MARLDKAAWGKSTLKTKEIEVEELGGTVLIRELPASYSADIASNIQIIQDGREQRAKVDTAKMERLQFAFGVIDSDGEPMFTEAEVKDLALRHGRVFKIVIAAIDDLSGVDKEAIEKAEATFPARAEKPGHNGQAGSSDAAGDRGSAVPGRAGA